MTKSSKQLMKILKFFANNTRYHVLELKKNNSKKYFKLVPQDAEDVLHSQGYIRFAEPLNHVAITTMGLEKLMTLENYYHKKWSLIISIIAIIISAIALLKSFGVF